MQGASKKQTLSDYVQRNWNNLHKKTINGRYAYTKDDDPRPEYARLGIELRLSFDELYLWCYKHWNEIKEMKKAGLKPSVGRLDECGHYELKNIILIDVTDASIKARQRAIKGTHTTSGQVLYFASMAQAGLSGFHPSLINQACKGTRRTHGGYKWELM